MPNPNPCLAKVRITCVITTGCKNSNVKKGVIPQECTNCGYSKIEIIDLNYQCMAVVDKQIPKVVHGKNVKVSFNGIELESKKI